MATRVLITGSSGFLGSELRRSLRPENFASLREVNILSRGGPSRVLEQAKEKNCSVVLHLAWDSNKNLAYDKSSVNSEWMESTLELARLCEEKGVIFAGLGTCLDEELNLEEIEDSHTLGGVVIGLLLFNVTEKARDKERK